MDRLAALDGLYYEIFRFGLLQIVVPGWESYQKMMCKFKRPLVKTLVAAWLGATILLSPYFSADAGQPGLASGFALLYVHLCMKNLPNLDRLRAELIEKKLQKLPPERAAAFLNGRDGDAWPVPYEGQLGNYVLVLLAHQSLCAIYARRVNTTDVERDFDYINVTRQCADAVKA